jgi:phenylalanine-4-hydroxylase
MQLNLLQAAVHPLYWEGMNNLGLTAGRIPDLSELNDRLARTNWRVQLIQGFVDDPATVYSWLSEGRFPIVAEMRPMHELERASQPDLFHDAFGHLPWLTLPAHAECMRRCGDQGIKAAQFGPEALRAFNLFYTHGPEFGLIRTKDGLRVYGAALCSSSGEAPYALRSTRPRRLRFDPERMMRTRFHFSDLQEDYFVLTTFRELYDVLHSELRPYYDRVLKLPLLAPGESAAGDVHVH